MVSHKGGDFHQVTLYMQAEKYFDVLDSFFISVLCDFEGFIFWGDISFGPLLQSNNSLVVLKFIDLRTDWLGLYAQNHFSS